MDQVVFDNALADLAYGSVAYDPIADVGISSQNNAARLARGRGAVDADYTNPLGALADGWWR